MNNFNSAFNLLLHQSLLNKALFCITSIQVVSNKLVTNSLFACHVTYCTRGINIFDDRSYPFIFFIIIVASLKKNTLLGHVHQPYIIIARASSRTFGAWNTDRFFWGGGALHNSQGLWAGIVALCGTVWGWTRKKTCHLSGPHLGYSRCRQAQPAPILHWLLWQQQGGEGPGDTRYHCGKRRRAGRIYRELEGGLKTLGSLAR